MANYYYVDYAFDGDAEQVKALGDLLNDLKSKSKKYEGLGRIHEALGIEHADNRGEWSHEVHDDYVLLRIATGWEVKTEIPVAIKDRFEGLNCWYQSYYDDENDTFNTNDYRRKYFKHNYYVDIDCAEMDVEINAHYETKEELLSELGKAFDTGLTSWDDVRELRGDVEEADGIFKLARCVDFGHAPSKDDEEFDALFGEQCDYGYFDQLSPSPCEADENYIGGKYAIRINWGNDGDED